MDTIELTPEEQANKRRGMIISIAIHVLIILLAILPFLKYPDPPPGQEGVLISFGEPDAGQGDDRPDVQQVDPTVTKTESQAEAQPAEQAASKAAEQKVVTTDDADARLKKQQADAEQKRKSDAQRAAEQEAARKRAAEDAARRAAEEEARKQAEAEKARKQYGDFFGGSGKGDQSKPGNTGDDKGDPNAQNLTGMTKGAGVVGAGLSNRGVRKSAPISDKSQNTGRVVIAVCVDRMGNVTKADFTQRGSTTTNAQLIDLARRNARSYLFSESSLDEQCGTITYDFRLQ
jgi:outer membrane biosynthesis protein TonB